MSWKCNSNGINFTATNQMAIIHLQVLKQNRFELFPNTSDGCLHSRTWFCHGCFAIFKFVSDQRCNNHPTTIKVISIQSLRSKQLLNKRQFILQTFSGSSKRNVDRLRCSRGWWGLQIDNQTWPAQCWSPTHSNRRNIQRSRYLATIQYQT